MPQTTEKVSKRPRRPKLSRIPSPTEHFPGPQNGLTLGYLRALAVSTKSHSDDAKVELGNATANTTVKNA